MSVYFVQLFEFLRIFVFHVLSFFPDNYPFRCEECGKGFNSNNTLNGHLNRHKGAGFFMVLDLYPAWSSASTVL